MYRLATYGVGITASLAGVFHWRSRWAGDQVVASSESNLVSVDPPYQGLLPTRTELITALREEDEFDILVIGGGATGAGVALDACTRGLKTALVEKYDYASATSSKSTKLIHGGVRYLQKAIMGLDRDQYHLVKEALHERANLLAIAPHLASPLPIMLPVYKWWQVPYFWAGIKLYDLVAGRKLVKSSYLIGKEKALESFPTLNSDKLCGAIVYYDGQQDDARMNLAIILSAIRNGGKCVNYVEVTNLLFEQGDDGEGKKVRGARLRDNITGEEWEVKAKSVVNATGPFTDSIRKMNDEKERTICQPAAGVHLTLPDYFCPRNMGLLDPATSDGRVIFFLPWQGKTIAGTTDRKCDVTYDPEATQKEVEFILGEVKHYLNEDVQVRAEDILSTWCGIRPLVTDPSAKDTQSLSRNHVVDVSESDLITIAGGKWTTYRAMAKDAVDAAVKACKLSPSAESDTDGLLLEGANGWSPTFYIKLVQQYGLDPTIAEHLSHAYGTKAPLVAELAAKSGKRWPVVGQKLVDDLPYIKAEVLFAVKQEYACKALDVISRRLRVSFLDVAAGNEIITEVVNIMGDELGWDDAKRVAEEEETRASLQSMNYKSIVAKEACTKTKIFEDTKKSAQIVADVELENSAVAEGAIILREPVNSTTVESNISVQTDVANETIESTESEAVSSL